MQAVEYRNVHYANSVVKVTEAGFAARSQAFWPPDLVMGVQSDGDRMLKFLVGC